MSEIIAKEKTVVVPGDELAKGMDCIPSFGTYREGDSIYASRLGLVGIDGKVIKIIPLSGVYIPKKGDVIIGRVDDIISLGWRVNIFSPYTSLLTLKDATSDFISRSTDYTKYYDFGDYIMASVCNVSGQMLIDLSMKGPGLRKLTGGRIIRITPNKVPRVIGKHGSMVSMIKNATDCKILVGQNGVIWFNGEPAQEVIVLKAIMMIEQKSHINGLTDKVKEFLEKETGKKVEFKEEPKKEFSEEPRKDFNGQQRREFNDRRRR